MRPLYEAIETTNLIILISPLYFFSVSSRMKIFIDRCQALWAKRFVLKEPVWQGEGIRKGGIALVGSTENESLLSGVDILAKYFFKSIEAEPYASLYIGGCETHDALKRLNNKQARADAFVKELLS